MSKVSAVQTSEVVAINAEMERLTKLEDDYRQAFERSRADRQKRRQQKTGEQGPVTATIEAETTPGDVRFLDGIRDCIQQRDKLRAKLDAMGDTAPLGRRKCSAHSKQTGKPCRQIAIPGGMVCHYHGGATPQVQRKARERLAALVDPSITRLGQLVQQRSSPAVALGAVKDVLDRNNLGADSHVVLEVGRYDALAKLSTEELLARHQALTQKLALPIIPGGNGDGE